MPHSMHYEGPAGPFTLLEENNVITHLLFGKAAPLGAAAGGTPLLQAAANQLDEYFAGKRRTFDLPLAPAGTEFQQLVWQALVAIPYGETRTYGQLAAAIGRPRAARAVGHANNRNPLPIFIPCHRVIGANGHLVGYAGGLGLKEQLLQLEGAR